MFLNIFFLKGNKFIGLNPFNPCHLWPIQRCIQTVGSQWKSFWGWGSAPKDYFVSSLSLGYNEERDFAS